MAQQPQQQQSVGTGLFLNGERETGQDVRSGNVTAALAIANICKTSLGPVGLDKMLVDDIGDVTITNDGATILKQLSVEHPAAKVLVELADLQDQEVGDGTTSVVIIASELLKRANEVRKRETRQRWDCPGDRFYVYIPPPPPLPPRNKNTQL